MSPFLVTLSIGALFAPFLIVANHLNYKSPLFVLFFLCALGTTFKLFYYDPELGGEHTFFGVALIVLGNISFIVGFLTTNKIIKRKSGYGLLLHPGSTLSKIVAALFLLFSITLLIIYFQKTEFFSNLLSGQLIFSRFFITEDGIRTSLAFLTMGAEFLLVAVLLGLATGHFIRHKFLYFCLVALILLTYLNSGHRTGIAMFILAVFIVLYKGKKERKKKSTFLVKATIVSSAIMLILFTTSVRNNDNTGGFGENLLTGLTVAFEHISKRPYLVGADKVGLIAANTQKTNGYLYGQSFTTIIFAPIPRILWKDKPPLRVGQYVGKEILLRPNASGVPPTLVGELFLNFSFVGIILGMVLLGYISRLSYNRFLIVGDEDKTEKAFYGIFLISIVFTGIVADFNGGFFTFLRMYAAFLILRPYYRGLSSAPVRYEVG